MVIKNIKIVTPTKVIENGYMEIVDGKIASIGEGVCSKDGIDGHGEIAMPGFIDIHIHGSNNIDFLTADKDDIKKAADSLYSEGVTTFLATSLTADYETLEKFCLTVKEAMKIAPNLGGIHFEGPFISVKYKGAQNPEYIVDPDSKELDKWIELSGNNVRLITMAPEKNGSMEFIEHATSRGVTCSAGHSDASFKDIEEAIKHGLTNTTHTHNAMSPHHHRNPGIVTASFYFDALNCECICDGIHVSPDTIKTFYKIVGPDRFMIITDALKIKHSDVEEFELFGLPCERKNGAAYLKTGPLAGSLLTLDQGVRNMKDWTGAGLISLSKISSTNAARSIHMNDRGSLEIGKMADFVLLDEELNVMATYKAGNLVYSK